MKKYTEYSKAELPELHKKLLTEFDAHKTKSLTLDMSRGKPNPRQIDSANGLITVLGADDYRSEDGTDCRNYGVLDGLPEARKLMGDIVGAPPEQVIVGGNSSLTLMHDLVARALLKGVYVGPVTGSKKPWGAQGKIKFICPVPGYDRHFAICEFFGIEMVTVPLNADGPDMNAVEELIKDKSVKGIWCVPKYANPEGITYSDEVVKRFAALSPAADDFRIFWDNAYALHHITDTPDSLLNIINECERAGNPHLPYVFCSTSKISFGGAGLSAVAASAENIKFIKSQLAVQTIGSDKLNQLRHVRFYKDIDGIKAQMEKHRTFIAPKFDVVLQKLAPLADAGIARFVKPTGGYFVSFHGLDGTAKRTVSLCKEAGVVLTGAGATYPYGKDPRDENIRIAPTYPSVTELNAAMDVFATAAALAAVEILLK